MPADSVQQRKTDSEKRALAQKLFDDIMRRTSSTDFWGTATIEITVQAGQCRTVRKSISESHS